MSAERARQILNRAAGFDKYSPHEAACLLDGLKVLLRAVHSMPCPVYELQPMRTDEI